MIYTSTENKKIKDIKKLNNKKYRTSAGKFLVEGEHLVLEAFKTGYLETLIIEQDESFSLDIDTMQVSKDVIRYVSELETSVNILGVCKIPKLKDIGNRVLALDGVQDPGNLGTIIRSSVAFGIDTILISNETVDVYNSKVIRASQGLIFHINIIRTDLFSTLLDLKKESYHIISTRLTDGKLISKIVINDKFAIIMGNEGSGVSEKISKISDSYVYIPMNGLCESLNVGVATSIILYELNKKEEV